jgi:periplasmic protein TonB
VAVGVSLSAVLHGVMLAAATSLHATETRRRPDDPIQSARRQPMVVELLGRERLVGPALTAPASSPGERPGFRPAPVRHLGTRARTRPSLTPVASTVASAVTSQDAPSASDAPGAAAGSSSGKGLGPGEDGVAALGGGDARPGCCGQGAGLATGAGTAAPARIAARPLANPRPIYPRQARLMGWEGTVVLRVLVDVQGKAAQVTVVAGSGYPVLDESAVDGARRWRFVPAMEGGRPVAMLHEVRIRFRLDDQAA